MLKAIAAIVLMALLVTVGFVVVPFLFTTHDYIYHWAYFLVALLTRLIETTCVLFCTMIIIGDPRTVVYTIQNSTSTFGNTKSVRQSKNTQSKA